MIEDQTIGYGLQCETLAVRLRVRGMHCHGCEHLIEASLHQLPGVRSVKADYPTEVVDVVFDPTATGLKDLCSAIAEKGYRCLLPGEVEAKRHVLHNLARVALGVAGIALIVLVDTEWISQGGAPDVAQHLSLGLIFVLGLLTGFHCIGMCGGFVLSYTASDTYSGQRAYLSHLVYGAGKTLSYTAIGAAFGILGAVVTFTPLLRGAAGVMAGIFLIVFGLNMVGVFTPLRKIWLRTPAWLSRFVGRQTHAHPRPFVIGLLNGLMIACGPLQAMYVMAAGTGSAAEGAKMLFAFGVGTLPVLLSFGVLTTLISGALTRQLLRASGAIVVLLGAVMINRGLILTGSGYDLRSVIGSFSAPSKPTPQPSPKEQSQTVASPNVETPAPTRGEAPPPPGPMVQTIVMDVVLSGYLPSRFTLRKGVPVKWIINGKQVTQCNSRIVVPKLGLEFEVKKGEQIIEFTPTEEGVIPWSCWMGMLHGQFVVMKEAPATPRALEEIASKPETPAVEASSPAPERAYTIVAGDTLRRIAVRVYRDERQWRSIADANPGLDPRRLRIGQPIRLPSPTPER
jgi:uncharacterized protein